jgi:hypothetical protein
MLAGGRSIASADESIAGSFAEVNITAKRVRVDVS